MTLSACGSTPRPVPIYRAELVDQNTLRVTVAACHATNRVTIAERTDEVALFVASDDSGDEDCTDAVRVVLGAPLGLRTLVDGHTRRETEVTRR